MERADLEQWKAREVARLLSLVETERRYYQEIVSDVAQGARLPWSQEDVARNVRGHSIEARL